MKPKRNIAFYYVVVAFLLLMIICMMRRGNKGTNAFFFKDGQETVEYEGEFFPLSCNLIRQNIELKIRKVMVFDEATLWALELEQLDVADPEDEIRMGGQYLGYFYVIEDKIYQMPLPDMNGYSQERDDEVIQMIRDDKAKFLERCRLVCSEEGTENIADEEGWHAYVEVDGEKRIFHMYNDYTGGTKEYERIVWEKGKGITYYHHGVGAGLMDVEIGLNLYESVKTEEYNLTKEEALDLVFEYYTDLTDKMVGLSFFETEDGRIGYKWNWEHIEDRPMFLEETHFFVNSRGDIYLFFEVYSDLYGSKGDYCRTEIFQNYAINMVNGQIMEERVYNELDMWEYSDDYRRYILEE